MTEKSAIEMKELHRFLNPSAHYVPTHYSFVKGAAEGTSPLNAFDNALIDAGVANFNLVKVSSILPPKCEHMRSFDFPKGMLLPIAYSCLRSNEKDEIISAAVGIGMPKDFESSNGLIMEFASASNKIACEKVVNSMVIEGMTNRNIELENIILYSVEHTVKNFGCVFSGIILW